MTEVTGQIEELKKLVQLQDSIIIMQLSDNNVFQVSGLGGIRHLQYVTDKYGKYHIDGTPQVVD